MTPEPFAWCKVNTSIFSLFPLLKFSVKPRQGWNPLYTEKQLRAAYAAGAKDMQERCAKVCDRLGGDIDPKNVDDVKLAANSLSHAIRALETK